MIGKHRVKRIIAGVIIGLVVLLVLISVPDEIQIPLGFAMIACLVMIEGWRDWRRM